VSLSTVHIGFAIRDFLEGREIEGGQVTRENPFADEKYEIEHIDISDSSNPVIYTSGGVFKLIILKVDPPRQRIAPEPREPRPIRKSLLWKPNPSHDEDEAE
jgi:hypothetical protein